MIIYDRNVQMSAVVGAFFGGASKFCKLTNYHSAIVMGISTLATYIILKNLPEKNFEKIDFDLTEFKDKNMSIANTLNIINKPFEFVGEKTASWINGTSLSHKIETLARSIFIGLVSFFLNYNYLSLSIKASLYYGFYGSLILLLVPIIAFNYFNKN